MGFVKKNEDGAEETEEIVLSPLGETVTGDYQALILCNHAEMVPILESNQFTDMVHILKLKYFHGTIESPKKAKRSTVKDRRLGFSVDLRGSPDLIASKLANLGEPLIEEDSFSSRFEVESEKPSTQRSFSEILAPERLRLIKDHPDFDKSINNPLFVPIVDKSFKKILANKFDYTMLLETRNIDISSKDMKQFISNHILL